MPAELKHRERQILTMLADGLSARQIAGKLALSIETVRWYIKQLYRELEVTSRAEAIRRAMSRGLLDAGVATPARRPPPRSAIGFANSQGVHIAYQTIGDGPIDVLFVHGFLSHLDLAWEDPEFAAFFESLGRVARVILFDKRGIGVSDRDIGPSTLEQTVADARCVLDAVGSTRAYIMGTSEGGAAAVLLASMRPSRIDGLILINTSPYIGGHGTTYHWVGHSAPQPALDSPETGQGSEPWSVQRFAPSRATNHVFRNWWSKLLRAAATPSTISTVLANARAVDIRQLLPSVTTRTLIVHRTGDRMVPLSAGRDFAARLPHARFVELPGNDHVYFVDSDVLAQTLVDYLKAPDAAPETRSWIAVVLCMAGIGASLDAKKREVVLEHGARFLRESEHAWTACFEGPSAAVRCARQLRALGRGRIGGMSLHVGACAVADGSPLGTTYERALSTARAAADGDVLITGTLRDILVGETLELAVHSVTAVEADTPAATTWLLAD